MRTLLMILLVQTCIPERELPRATIHVEHDYSEKRFDVGGSTFKEAHNNVLGAGHAGLTPRAIRERTAGSGGAVVAWVRPKVQMTWDLHTRGRCYVHRVDIQMHTVMIMPTWERGVLAEDLEWSRWVAETHTHEKGHVDIAWSSAMRAAKAIQALEPDRNCAVIDEAAALIVEEHLSKINDLDRAFDSRSYGGNHVEGVDWWTSPVPWPPNDPKAEWEAGMKANPNAPM